MAGRCAPIRSATAGVRTVLSAPVSRISVTEWPLADRVTIGARFRVATMILPIGLMSQPTVSRPSCKLATRVDCDLQVDGTSEAWPIAAEKMLSIAAPTTKFRVPALGRSEYKEPP